MKVNFRHFLATIFLLLASSSFAANLSPNASQLDLGALANFDYAGTDSIHEKNTCRLFVSAIRQDFSGRLIQDYRLWTENFSAINFNIRLKGPNRIREGKDSGNGRTKFSIALDDYSVEITSDSQNPLAIYEFQFLDNSGVSGNPTTVMNCQNVKASPRQ